MNQELYVGVVFEMFIEVDKKSKSFLSFFRHKIKEQLTYMPKENR